MDRALAVAARLRLGRVRARGAAVLRRGVDAGLGLEAAAARFGAGGVGRPSADVAVGRARVGVAGTRFSGVRAGAAAVRGLRQGTGARLRARAAAD